MALTDAVVVIESEKLADEVLVTEGEALSDSVLVVDGVHDAHTASKRAVQSVLAVHGQMVHAEHAEAPGIALNLPSSQSMQLLAPISELYRPAAQAVHTKDCVAVIGFA